MRPFHTSQNEWPARITCRPSCRTSAVERAGDRVLAVFVRQGGLVQEVADALKGLLQLQARLVPLRVQLVEALRGRARPVARDEPLDEGLEVRQLRFDRLRAGRQLAGDAGERVGSDADLRHGFLRWSTRLWVFTYVTPRAEQSVMGSGPHARCPPCASRRSRAVPAVRLAEVTRGS